jgi:hypothetical protein
MIKERTDFKKGFKLELTGEKNRIGVGGEEQKGQRGAKQLYRVNCPTLLDV